MLRSAWQKAAALKKPPNTRPFSIRLTESERALLLQRAGQLPLGAYIRNLILTGGVQAQRQRWKNPVKDHDALGRVLALLGQSRIANNLNQLAKAVNIGALPVSQEVEADLTDASLAVKSMRRDLLHALGMSDAGSS